MNKKINVLPVKPLENEEYKPRNAKDNDAVMKAWNEYRESATVHCLGHAGNPRHNKIRRMTWLAILLLLLTLLLLEIYYQTDRYFKYSTITKHYTTMVKAPKFPAVTICNFNRVTKNRDMDEFTRELLRQTYMVQPTNMTYFNNLNESRVNAVNLTDLFTKYSPKVNETFISCVFHGDVMPCEQIFQSKITGYGLCATFYPDNLKAVEKNTTSTIKTKDGLSVTLLVNQEDYFIAEPFAGFLVLVHDSDDEPSIGEYGLALSPGFSARLAVRKVIYRYLPHPVKAFNNDYCLDTESRDFVNPLLYHTPYSYSACLSECRATYVKNLCQCRDVLMNGNERVCSALERIGCLNNAYASFSEAGNSMCNCHMPCEYESFETTLSQAFFPREGYVEEYSPAPNASAVTFRRNNVLNVRVFYQTSLVNIQEQVLELTTTDIIGSIGGFLGLFIGASIASVFELFEYIIIVIVIKFKLFMSSQAK